MIWSEKHYNLIVFGTDSLPIFHAGSGQQAFPENRLFEYTEGDLRDRYQQDIASLAELPTLVVSEISPSDEEQPAFLTRIGQIEKRGGRLHFLFEHLLRCFPADAFFGSEHFDIHVRETGIDERFRTHWAVKRGNLVGGLRQLFEERAMENSPAQLFAEQWTAHIPGAVCLFLAHHEQFDGVARVVESVCYNHQLKILQVGSLGSSDTLLSSTLDMIKGTGLVITDLTNANDNVLFETGIAVGLGLNVILIAQDNQAVPPGLADREVIRYRPADDGYKQLELDLQEVVRGTGGEWSPVLPVR